VNCDLGWVYGKSGNEYKSPTFIFMDFMGWEAIYMGKIDK